jgi:hypothetical protein
MNLVASSTISRFPPRPKLNEAPGDVQLFQRLSNQSLSTE